MKFRKFLLLIATAALLSSCGCAHQTSDSSEEPYVPETDPYTIFNGYYKDFGEWNNYQELKHKLYDLIRKDYRLNYYTKTWNEEEQKAESKTNWSTNQNADQSLFNQDKVYLLYNDNDEFKGTGTTTDWQREHCFPASLMTGYGTGEAVEYLGTATDFHNLYASYSSGNSAHSNLCYGEVANFEGESRKTGNATYIPDVAFEPNAMDKGKVSRCIFYIATMFGDDNWVEAVFDESKDFVFNGVTYKEKVNLVKGIYLTENATCTLHESARGNKCHSNLSTLIKWNNEVLPDRHELQHCNFVQGQQHNRNPFIDFPGLVDYVWGDKRLEKGSLYSIPNIYDILKLNSTNVANISINNVKYSYDGGDTYSVANDLEVFGLTNNLQKVNIDGLYTIDGMADGQTIANSDNGKKISFNMPDVLSTSYTINVANSAFKNSSYVGMPKKSLFTDPTKKLVRNQTLHLNNMDWNVTTEEAVTIDLLDENYQEVGVKIGSSSSPASALSFTTASSVDVDGMHVVKKIYIEANSTGSYNGGFNVKIKLDGVEMLSQSYKVNTNVNFLSCGLDLSSMKQGSGVVSIEISNIRNGIQIGRIALDVAATSD